MAQEKRYTIGEFAKLTQVTERTLRFYDKKSLLKPSSYNEHGHRLYSNKDILQLQKILTLKYLDYTLEEITEYLDNPELDLKSSLRFQHEALQKKREHLDQVIDTLERVQYILQETDQIEPDYLLMLIYMLQHETKQKEWFMQHFSKSTVDALFMEGRSEERLEFERKSMALISQIKQYGKEGKAPDDPLVQEKCMEVLQLISSIIEPGVVEELAGRIEELEASSDHLFPDFLLLQDEEEFLQQAFGVLDQSKVQDVFKDVANLYGKEEEQE